MTDLPDGSRQAGETRLAFVLAGCGFASGFAIRVVDPIVPLLAAEYGTSVATASLLVTVFAVCYALGQPVLGPLGDAIGKARLVIFCAACGSMLVLACAAATGFTSLAALRAASGFMAGGIVPLSVALVSERVVGATRQAAIGRFIMAPILGQMLGGALSGVVAETFGWRAVFVLTGLLLLVGAASTYAVAGTARRARAERFSLRSIAGNYALVFASRRAVKLYLLVMCVGVAAIGIFPFIAAILNARLGTGAGEAGLVIGGFGVGGLIYGLSVRRLVRTVGPVRMSRLGGLGAGLALAAFALPAHWIVVVLVFAVFGFFFFMMNNTLAAQVTDLAPTARGTAIALFACSMFLAQGLGPAAIGPLLYVLPAEAIVVALGLVLVGVGLLAARQVRPPSQT